jgi:Zn finger protein HypA/HybF involved in hydrogenase expression
MNNQPYFCPNCHSNRVKFSLITTHSQAFMKDARDGSITEMADDAFLPSVEPDIQCRVCSFIGNELRFIKQAEREPRM